MKQESFYRIYGWMRHAPYGLRGTTLEVYAALYDLTRKEEKVYSRAWLCEWLEMPNNLIRPCNTRTLPKGAPFRVGI